jgi:hypothetical protein
MHVVQLLEQNIRNEMKAMNGKCGAAVIVNIGGNDARNLLSVYVVYLDRYD